MLQPPQPEKGRNQAMLGLAIAAGILVVLCIGGAVVNAVMKGRNTLPDNATPPSGQSLRGSGAGWVDVTAKYRAASFGNPTIKGNDQWEPIVEHVIKVEYQRSRRTYRVFMDLSADDLRRQLPGVMVQPGVGACMTIQFWGSALDGIAVYVSAE
jgi:hypothetical protein